MTVILFVHDGGSGPLPALREIPCASGEYFSHVIPDDMTVRDISIVGECVHVFMERKEVA